MHCQLKRAPGRNQGLRARNRALATAVVPLLLGFAVLATVAPSPLAALPVELGVTVAAGQRGEDRLSRGFEKFRTSLAPTVVNEVSGDDFRDFHSAEIFLRLGIFDDPNSFAGLTVGQFIVPEQELREVRSDLAFTRLGFTFDVPYFMFTYHYLGQIDFFRPLRQYQWEGGFGFGFVPTARIRATGNLISPNQFLPYNLNQISGQGTIARLELGLRRYLTGSLFLRGGLRFTYAYMGKWTGTINGGDGELWYLRDGGITPLSSVNAFVAPQTQFDPNLGIVQASFARNPVEVPIGVTEIQFSLGWHF